MKSKSLLRLLILTSILISVFSCKKDADYLDKYTGSFTFTIVRHDDFYPHIKDTTYTLTSSGQIKIYAGSLKNTYSNTIDTKNTYRRLAIYFGSLITPEVLENGDFVYETSGGDYSLSGRFNNKDEVQFTILQQSAGFSIGINVTGTRN